jgi:hypothetical protein
MTLFIPNYTDTKRDRDIIMSILVRTRKAELDGYQWAIGRCGQSYFYISSGVVNAFAKLTTFLGLARHRVEIDY